jgi:hypothetical protein
MGKDKDRITVRLSDADLKNLSKIQASGDFEDISATVRWCIHFSGFLLKSIPAAVINSFVESECVEEKKDEDNNKNKEEVLK